MLLFFSPLTGSLPRFCAPSAHTRRKWWTTNTLIDVGCLGQWPLGRLEIKDCHRAPGGFEFGRQIWLELSKDANQSNEVTTEWVTWSPYLLLNAPNLFFICPPEVMWCHLLISIEIKAWPLPQRPCYYGFLLMLTFTDAIVSLLF